MAKILIFILVMDKVNNSINRKELNLRSGKRCSWFLNCKMQKQFNFLNQLDLKEIPDEGLREWKKNKSEARMVAIWRLLYEIKKKKAEY